ncbi:Flp pilus assembly protein TadG [Fulvimarina manganoxydans]|uniref:Flp pilus assembly protein TadG n=1 Tax=Fulvimarina manganoxydans TaxID=937218 RepID=A0A1W2AXK9_9HYPH|nr:TadE/TadG family type IV pilus assembly protein [Fulvimarina manganoxydans]SMC65449.1 Flp pilus assembly protein TadG [Fulvimarina manganoxydans]
MTICKSGPRLWTRFARDRSGVAAVEFAFVGLPFVLILYAIIETGLILTGNFLLERGSEQVGRLVLTGQLQGQERPPTREEFRKLICDQIAPYMRCDKLKVDLRSYNEFSSMELRTDMRMGHVNDDGFRYELGGANSISVLRTYYEWPWEGLYFKLVAKNTGGNALLSSVSAFRNEPF